MTGEEPMRKVFELPGFVPVYEESCVDEEGFKAGSSDATDGMTMAINGAFGRHPTDDRTVSRKVTEGIRKSQTKHQSMNNRIPQVCHFAMYK